MGVQEERKQRTGLSEGGMCQTGLAFEVWMEQKVNAP